MRKIEEGTFSAVHVHFGTYNQGTVHHKSLVVLVMLDCMYEARAVVGHIIEQLVPTQRPAFDMCYTFTYALYIL